MYQQRTIRKRVLALSIGALVAFSGGVSAQSEREAELEARIAQLERLVGELLEKQAAAPTPPPAPAVPAGQQPVQATTVVPTANPGTRFAFGGFIKANASWSDYSDGNPPPGGLARDFYLPGAIPVGGRGESAVFDAHAKQSRFWLTTDTVLDNGSRLGSRFEMDFAVPTGGDERNTNTYNPVLRRAFFTYDNWLFGQEWSTFMELGALPEATDFIGPTEGMVFNRQAQVRYTKGAWSVALENPETTLLPFGGGARIVTDDNTVPDIVARYTHRADWGFVTFAGLLRQLRNETAARTATATGYGASITSRINLGPRDDLRMMVTAGSGIGRYTGLNFFEDGVLRADGGIEPLDVIAAYAAWRHVWTGTWRSNFILGYTSVDNDPRLTGLNANAEASSFRANLMWTPAPRVDMGIELSTAKRELERGTSGTQNRVDFMARYSF